MARNRYQKPARSSGTALTSDILKSVNPSSYASKLKINPSNDLSRLSMGTRLGLEGIDFGSPSEKSSKTSSSVQQSDHWTNLLQSAASSGVSDLLGGGGLLSAGLNYLTSSFTKLFSGGNEKTVAPLVKFALPQTEDRTVYTSGANLLPGTSSTPSMFPGTTSYGSVQLSPQSSGAQRAQIVQTIKTALLTSSSLNDIIGEL